MRKLPVWLIALALTAVGAAGTIGVGYQKANDEGINGTVNIITSQAIGVEEIRFHGEHEDDTGIAVTAEDGLSYIIGIQLNNGDEYQDEDQYINIWFKNYAKRDMVVKLTCDFGITNPDQADAACDDIHIWYDEETDSADPNEASVLGQIDPWTYLIKLQAATVVTGETVIIGTTATDETSATLDHNPLLPGATLTLYSNGAPWTNWEMDPKTGEITFPSDIGTGETITADYTYSGATVRMMVDVGNTVAPGFYTFATYIEPTNWESMETQNMGLV